MRILIALIIALVMLLLVMLSGCCSGGGEGQPGRPSEGWSVSLINITVQLGGTRTDPTIQTKNEVGPNAIQTHILPVDSVQKAGATNVGL